MDNMDNRKSEIKAALKARHINLSALCRAFHVPYKTFHGWLDGRQNTLASDVTVRVVIMLNSVGIEL